MADKYQAAAKQYPEFTKDMVDIFIETFKQYDTDNSGEIDHNELKTVLKGYLIIMCFMSLWSWSLGQENITDKEIKQQIDEVDKDKSGTVSFAEFLAVFISSTYLEANFC